MSDRRHAPPTRVIGPRGEPMTLDDLPPANTKRWVVRRKAEVVTAVQGGLLTIEDACKRYRLTMEEFLAWQRAIQKNGMPGLRATRIQQYRKSPSAPSTAAYEKSERASA